MSKVYDIASAHVDRYAALDPIAATAIGVAGHEDRMTDYSPEGHAARADEYRSTLAELRQAPVAGARDRVCREAMTERLELELELFGMSEHLRELNVLHSPLQSTRQVFDLMARDTEEDWRNIAARMRLAPEALRSFQHSLSRGQAEGMTASRRQVTGCARQAEIWAGLVEGTPSFFQGLVDEYERSSIGNRALATELASAADRAAVGFAEMRTFLLERYAPDAAEKDAVGSERYELGVRAFNGTELNLTDTYRWGWEQLAWTEREMAETAEKIAPGGGVDAALALLGADPARAIEGEDAFREWMQGFQEETITRLDGVHFDIPDPVKRIECLIAPPGGALAMYYTGPSEDFSRPGRVWYPTGGKTRFPLWSEVSIAYHEGVPGHHFQIATTVFMREQLSRYQRLLGGTSGHAEGWGLYAERLMAELGYLDNPDYYLGMLASQAFRSARVVIDIGMHLELKTPTDQPFHPGETWTPALGLEFLLPRCPFEEAFARSEIDRYLGFAGQAISYKVGERAWLAARESAKRVAGADFDLKAWHTRALELGPMGLAQMAREMGAVA